MKQPHTYEQSGVSIAQGDAWVGRIKELVRKHPRAAHPANSIGGFAGVYDQGGDELLVACTDGVGTKVELARRAGKLDGLGQDLVAMSLNDMVTLGAKPMFFLDYIACGKLDAEYFAPVIESIFAACAACSTAVLGGETAEMPTVYRDGAFDLAGFAVGRVAKDKILDCSKVASGDVLIGLASNGVHSNGFSLVNRVLSANNDDLEQSFDGSTLADALLAPTRLYVSAALKVFENHPVHSMAHITGGGLEDNIVRALNGMRPRIDYSSWRRPAVFDWLKAAPVEESEMRRVFNLGIGFVIVAPPASAPAIIDTLKAAGESPHLIGDVTA